jgi:hypothetical protein
MKKTTEKTAVGNRMAVVYEGPRGGKYIKKDGKFVPLRNVLKGGVIDYEKNYVECDTCNPETPKYKASAKYLQHLDKAREQLMMNKPGVAGVTAFDMNRTEKLASAHCYNEVIENGEECPKREVKPDFVMPSEEEQQQHADIMAAFIGGKKAKKAAAPKKQNKKK